MLSAEARAIRGGETRLIPAEDLAPRDIVLLESGDKIPVDLRLIDTKNLRPRDDDTKIMFYEVYADDAAFAAHWNGRLVACCRAETTGMISKLAGTPCNLQE